ncbi:MAG: hypothetical protein JSR45_13980 [Proteobacteria bacterium]|nr:hypothetical protein [Pseudomonadota bacterium]
MSDDFMAVAGLAIPDVALKRVMDDLLAIKKGKGGPTETKWANVKSRRDSAHRAFVDYFAEAVGKGRIHFHIRFAPFAKYDHSASGPKRRIDTTSKMHYQLLLHRAVQFYGPHYKLRIRPDNGDCTAALVDQLDSLHDWGRHHYKTPLDCIESIQPSDSRRDPLLQLLDVPLGAFTAIRNARDLKGPKRELADYVSEKFNGLDLTKNSPKSERVFSVWNVVPSGPPVRGPWG